MTETTEKMVKQVRQSIMNSLDENPDLLAPGAYYLRQVQYVGNGMNPFTAIELIDQSYVNRAKFDVLRFAAASAVESDGEVPEKLRKWVAGFLRGEIHTPNSHAGTGSQLYLHMIIHEQVQYCIDEGYNVTRNDASEPLSACDIVANALSELNMQPSTFESIKRIYYNMRKKLRRLRDPMELFEGK